MPLVVGLVALPATAHAHGGPEVLLFVGFLIVWPVFLLFSLMFGRIEFGGRVGAAVTSVAMFALAWLLLDVSPLRRLVPEMATYMLPIIAACSCWYAVRRFYLRRLT